MNTMIREHLLWNMTLSPSGKTIKEDTFLGASLKFIGALIVVAIIFGAAIAILSVL